MEPLQPAGAAVEVEVSGVGPVAEPDADDDASDRDEGGKVSAGDLDDRDRRASTRDRPADAEQHCAGYHASVNAPWHAADPKYGEDHHDDRYGASEGKEHAQILESEHTVQFGVVAESDVGDGVAEG